MQAGIEQFLRRVYPDADEVTIEGFAPLPGGYSRETFLCDAIVHTGGNQQRLPLILRKDPPLVQSILQTDRVVEHHLIEAIRANTTIPVTRSIGCETDPVVFGEAAMVLERAAGSSKTSDLFNGGIDDHQVDEVIGHLCEILAELHTTPVDTIDPDGALRDPRGVGIDTSSWDTYIDSTCEYYVRSYEEISIDPSDMIVLDMFLTLRRTKPRPLHLAVVHGDFNPANFLYADGKVTALIDWENARIGDPREDLGWMTTMDVLSDTSVMDHPRDKGGFLAYYNELTGWDVTQDEIDWFTLFGTANISVPINAAIRRRVRGEHQLFSQLYMLQASAATLPNLVRLMNYPGVDL